MKAKKLALGLLLTASILSLPACKKEKTPLAMTITELRITDFPSTASGGSSWDLTTGADLYVQVLDGSGVVLYDAPTYFEDATGNSTLTFTPASPINLNCPTCEYSLRLYDLDDLDADDLIGAYLFTPYVLGNNEKNESFGTISYNASDAAFSMDFTYDY